MKVREDVWNSPSLLNKPISNHRHLSEKLDSLWKVQNVARDLGWGSSMGTDKYQLLSLLVYFMSLPRFKRFSRVYALFSTHLSSFSSENHLHFWSCFNVWVRSMLFLAARLWWATPTLPRSFGLQTQFGSFQLFNCGHFYLKHGGKDVYSIYIIKWKTKLE